MLCPRKEDAEGFRLRRGTASPPVSCVSSVGRRKSLPKRQRLHPTRVVAQVGTCWRASAHKGSPLFPRRAPGLITVDPEGSLDLPRAGVTSAGDAGDARTPSMLRIPPGARAADRETLRERPKGRESGRAADQPLREERSFGSLKRRVARACAPMGRMGAHVGNSRAEFPDAGATGRLTPLPKCWGTPGRFRRTVIACQGPRDRVSRSGAFA